MFDLDDGLKSGASAASSVASPGSSGADCCGIAQQLCDFLFVSLEGALPFDRIAIAGIAGDQLTQRAVRARLDDRTLGNGYQGTLRRGTLASVLASGQARVLNDLAAYARLADLASPTQQLVQEGYLASLTCPLEHEGEPVGLLFFNAREREVYRPEHVEVVQRIAPMVARMLASCVGLDDTPSLATLTHSLASIGRAARAASEEEVLIARVLDRVREGVVVDDVLDRVYEHLHALIPYDRIGFAAIEGDRVVARWARSRFPMHLPRGYSQRLASTSLRAVIESGTPRILNDLEGHLARHPYSQSTRLIVDEGHRASLTFFLGTREAPLGFLFFSCATASVYSHAHVARLRRLTAPLTAALEKARLYEDLAIARGRAEELLRVLMPASIAGRLQAGETDLADEHDATVMFADLVAFTEWSTPLKPIELLTTLRSLYARVHESAMRHGVTRIRIMGDGYMAAAGVADDPDDHAARLARHALDVVEIVRQTSAPDGRPLEVRVGVNTGPVICGVLGGEDLHYDVWGPSVSMAARLESHGAPGRVQVSEETARRLRGRFDLEARGDVTIKGLGSRKTFWLNADATTAGGR